MIEIEKPQIECIEDSANSSYGKYVVEPLERGYGITLGNALRRIMLSSLPGTAATAIKIAGVQHEFSTIPGVKEDVTEIVLNVKSLITKLHNAEGTKTVFIEATGPCEVKAGDIKCDSEVEILNPDLHIATLDAGATLNMELTLSHGRGYVPADRNKPAQTTIGLIPVDSIYTPVYKVNYTVENTRVGNMTDFDKLTLEVWTDGTISPRDAVSLGAKILCDHFSLFTDLSDAMGSKSTVVEKAEAMFAARKAETEGAGEEVQEDASDVIDIDQKPEITYEDFEKLQFQVGEIIACEEVKKSKKLLCSQVRVGSQVKQIVSGIKAHYSAEEMVGKKVMVLVNLKPAKLAGIVSEGMLLCAEDAEGNLALVIPEKEMPAGAEIC